MYGWTREYIVDNLSFDDVEIFYREGMESDLIRRGFDIKRGEKNDNIDDLRELYYTEEELKTIEKYKNKVKK